jgi:hypothetical protein
MTRQMILAEQNAHGGGMWFVPDDATLVAELPAGEVVKPKRRRVRKKPVEKPLDPKVVAMARELRDRWHEQPERIALPQPKYDVRRIVDAQRPAELRALLAA